MRSYKKGQLIAVLAAALAALTAAIFLLVMLFGRAGSGADDTAGSYERHFNAAEAAYNRRDYDEAVDELNLALDIEETEEAYLLMAEIYEARDEPEQARRVLLTGYANLGGSELSSRLDRLNSLSPQATAAPAASSVTVGGRTYPADTSSVVLSNRGLENSDLAAICTLTELENLSVSDNAITDLAPITQLEKLTSLQLSNNNITDISPLAHLEELKTLYLDGNPVDDLSPLYQLHNLRTLSMKSVSVTQSELDALEQALPDCYVFSDTREEEPPEELRAGSLTFNSDVTELDLSGQGLIDISMLAKCSLLARLDLRDNDVSDLSPLAELHELEKLNLWNNRVSDLGPLRELARLRSLDLDSNRVTDLSPLAGLDQLEELRLNGNTPASLEALRRLPGLRRLTLKNSGITDGDLEVLATLTNLTELALDDNPKLTGPALEQLVNALPNCTITYSEPIYTAELGGHVYNSDAEVLLLSGTGVTSLEGLEKFSHLKTLDLDGNDVTDLSPLYGLTGLKNLSLRANPNLGTAEIDALRAALPDCEIRSDEPESDAVEEEEEQSVEAPEPEDAGAYDKGLRAALEAAGTGSGYAILSWEHNSASESARTGFLDMVGELGMHLVYDETTAQTNEDFSGLIADMRKAGADVVFLAADNETLGLFTAEAAAAGYSAKIVQIW